MTPCELCWRNHFGCDCQNRPLMLLADWELPPEPECHCGAPMNESDLACTQCRREAIAYVPVLVCALDELYWRRVNHKTLGSCEPRQPATARLPATVRSADAATREDAELGEARQVTTPLTAPSIYDLVAPGALAALGLALGNLAPLVRLLGGWS